MVKSNEFNISRLFIYPSECNFLHSYDICLKIANDIGVNFEKFFYSIPNDCMKKVFIIYCALNGMKDTGNDFCKKYYPRTIDDIVIFNSKSEDIFPQAYNIKGLEIKEN